MKKRTKHTLVLSLLSLMLLLVSCDGSVPRPVLSDKCKAEIVQALFGVYAGSYRVLCQRDPLSDSYCQAREPQAAITDRALAGAAHHISRCAPASAGRQPGRWHVVGPRIDFMPLQ